ncbi:hypothetical protein EDD17DRAFT_1756164 [Pisolithus thermaeus]|nr:hypothetical protein EV401DRAFT_2066020 [Pisolithus croceorrhizus]KAI6163548.1 hypothetical protein EDD17DRAFT_1756164 [Pisolithus thermaeus]
MHKVTFKNPTAVVTLNEPRKPNEDAALEENLSVEELPYLTFYVAALFLAAECKTFLQVILCQGVATGFFVVMLFGSTPAIVSHCLEETLSSLFRRLFNRWSIGGTVLPIFTQQLFMKVGFKWSVRAIAFIISFVIIVANLLIRPRLPPSNVKGGLFDWRAFKNPAFACCVLAYDVSSFMFLLFTSLCLVK